MKLYLLSFLTLIGLNTYSQNGLYINDITANESVGNLTFTVTLIGNVPESFTVDYVTSDGTAEDGSDYTATSGTLTFTGMDGEIQTFIVPIIDDVVYEPTEYFNITLSNLSTTLVEIADGEGIGTIIDDDTMLQGILEINKTADLSVVSAAEEVINYTITVTNTGSEAVYEVVVTDPLVSNLMFVTGDTNSNNLLDITETWIYSATYTVTQSDIDNYGIDQYGNVDGDGDIDNCVTVGGDDSGGTALDPETDCIAVLINIGNLTYVPDDNFEQYLIDHSYDDVLDNYVLTANISTITNLYIAEKDISNLTGIQDFESLQSLNCSYNNLDELDISNNQQLTTLTCYVNNLDELDISNNLQLTILYCDDNNLSELNLSNNSLITKVSCNYNQISQIDLSNNPLLDIFNCKENQIASLDFSNNPELRIMQCRNNLLLSLDFSQNPILEFLNCHFNQITTIDISNSLILKTYSCGSNQLVEVDLSNHSLLEYVNIRDNQLRIVNLQNGNNQSIGNDYFWIDDNPYLFCVEVDDPTWSNANWTNVDTQTTFSLDCNYYLDTDGDTVPDIIEDINGDGDFTNDDTDNDGIPDYLDPDDDNDTVPTIIEAVQAKSTNSYLDTDDDGIPNYLDDDDDGDGTPTAEEDYDNDGDPTNDDINNNGIPDYLDELVTAGVEEGNSLFFRIFPNPVNNVLSIEFIENLTLAHIKISNLQGQVIYAMDIQQSGSIKINVSNFNSGVYFVKVSSESKSQSKKVIIQ